MYTQNKGYFTNVDVNIDNGVLSNGRQYDEYHDNIIEYICITTETKRRAKLYIESQHLSDISIMSL